MKLHICVPATQFRRETKEGEYGEKVFSQNHMSLRLRHCPRTWRHWDVVPGCVLGHKRPRDAGALGNLSPCTKAPPPPWFIYLSYALLEHYLSLRWSGNFSMDMCQAKSGPLEKILSKNECLCLKCGFRGLRKPMAEMVGKDI